MYYINVNRYGVKRQYLNIPSLKKGIEMVTELLAIQKNEILELDLVSSTTSEVIISYSFGSCYCSSAIKYCFD